MQKTINYCKSRKKAGLISGFFMILSIEIPSKSIIHYIQLSQTLLNILSLSRITKKDAAIAAPAYNNII